MKLYSSEGKIYTKLSKATVKPTYICPMVMPTEKIKQERRNKETEVFSGSSDILGRVLHEGRVAAMFPSGRRG